MAVYTYDRPESELGHLIDNPNRLDDLGNQIRLLDEIIALLPEVQAVECHQENCYIISSSDLTPVQKVLLDQLVFNHVNNVI